MHLPSDASSSRTVAAVKRALDDIQAGKIDAWRYATVPRHPIKELWPRLADLAGRLQALAEKQLAGTAFTADEIEFDPDLRRKTGALMFHTGEPSETPRDDAPRIADVVYNPQIGEYLEVGIGRPRLLYVLYPTKTGEVLCRGAVLPYYEFRSKTRLDDSEWMTRLDSPDPLQPPGPRRSATGILWAAAAVVGCAAVWLVARRRRKRAPGEGTAA